MQNRAVFKQPKAFYLIFSIELWERFGFYGLNVILPVYMSKELALSSGEASILFSVFGMLLYGGIAIGGYIGDKVLGTKRTIIYSTCVLLLGYLLMAFSRGDRTLVFVALSIIAVGAGLFKSNPSALLSTLYEKGDSRIDGAFTMYYMAINIGAMVSMLLTPWLSSHPWLIEHQINYTLSFACSSLGMFIALVNFIFMLKTIASNGSAPDFAPLVLSKLFLVIVGTILAVVLCYFMLQIQLLASVVMVILIIGILIKFFKETFNLHGVARAKMLVSLVFGAQIFVFFIMYNQIYTSVNFFTILNVRPQLFGITLDPQSFQTLDAIYIIIFSPVLAYFYSRTSFNLALKISFGVFCASLMFLIMYFAAKSVGADGYASPIWVELAYVFMAFGELLTSALGLSMMAQLVPAHLVGFAMGAYFLSTSAATFAAGQVAAFVDHLLPEQISFEQLSRLNPAEHLAYQLEFAGASSQVFLGIFIIGGGLGVIFMLASGVINKFIKE